MNSRATLQSVSPAATVPIRVRDYAHADRAHWDEFVFRCPEATFFHRIGWKDVIEGCFGHRTHASAELPKRAMAIAWSNAFDYSTE